MDVAGKFTFTSSLLLTIIYNRELWYGNQLLIKVTHNIYQINYVLNSLITIVYTVYESKNLIVNFDVLIKRSRNVSMIYEQSYCEMIFLIYM